MWPKNITTWISNNTCYISVPFTWLLPHAKFLTQQQSFLYEKIVIGGPAIQLMHDYIQQSHIVQIKQSMPGVLQRVNKYATRTTVGCPRKCKFCGIGRGLIEPEYLELKNWPNLPVVMDNNILASSYYHFDKVIERLQGHAWCDFNQGIDVRLLTKEHAKKLASLKKPKIRLALDNIKNSQKWMRAFLLLREAGIAKKNISSYCLIGFDSGPVECWKRCEFVSAQKINAYPMWYHNLSQLTKNTVSMHQKKLGWSGDSRKEIMGYYYKHRGKPYGNTYTLNQNNEKKTSKEDAEKS